MKTLHVTMVIAIIIITVFFHNYTYAETSNKPVFQSNNVKHIVNYTGYRPLDCSHDGKSILVATGTKYLIFDLNNNSIKDLNITEITGDQNNEALFSQDDSNLYFLFNGNIYLHNLQNHESTAVTNVGNIISFDISTSDEIFYSQASHDILQNYHYTVWKSDSLGKNVQEIISNDDMTSFSISPDNTKLLYFKTLGPHYRDIATYDLNTKQYYEIPQIRINMAENLHWAPNGNQVIYREIGPSTGSKIVMTDLQGNSELLAGDYLQNVRDPIVSPDGKYLFYVNENEGSLDKATFSTPIPEFSFSIQILLISIISSIVFYRLKFGIN